LVDYFRQVDTDETLADAVRTAAGAGGTDIVLVAVDGRSQTKVSSLSSSAAVGVNCFLLSKS
jgi:hypothetical protein